MKKLIILFSVLITFMLTAQTQIPSTAIYFTSPDSGWAVGKYGSIHFTTDGGFSWIQRTSGTINLLTSLHFSKSFGVAVGPYGTVSKTTNNGINWQAQQIGSNPNLVFPSDVFLIDDTTGVIVGAGSLILKTTDAGNTWNTQQCPDSINLSAVYFKNSNIGMAAGEIINQAGSGVAVILKTTDGGASWNIVFQYSNYASGSAGIQHIGGEKWAVVSDRPVLFFSNDDGSTWTIKNFNLSNSGFSDVFFSDENNGLITGSQNSYMRTWSTHDGGNSWTVHNFSQTGVVGTATGFPGVWYICGVYLTGNVSFMMKSYDGGLTWTTTLPVELESFSASLSGSDVVLQWTTATELNNLGFEIERNYNSSDFVNIGFVKGKGTTTNKSGYTFTDTEIHPGRYTYRLKQVDFDGKFQYSNEVHVDATDAGVNSFSLQQNFPNPFNPSTTISYSLSKQAFVSIKVFDPLGREISVLVNEEKTPGDYELTWNAGSLPGGVYLYQLRAGDFVDSKKMILMK